VDYDLFARSNSFYLYFKPVHSVSIALNLTYIGTSS